MERQQAGSRVMNRQQVERQTDKETDGRSAEGVKPNKAERKHVRVMLSDSNASRKVCRDSKQTGKQTGKQASRYDEQTDELDRR
jgi:hypothetical protein